MDDLFGRNGEGWAAFGCPNAFKSGDTYVNASLTRCVRVPVGVHQVRARLTAVGTGSAWVDDYTLRIDQLD